jgi:hypothetical protein
VVQAGDGRQRVDAELLADDRPGGSHGRLPLGQRRQQHGLKPLFGPGPGRQMVYTDRETMIRSVV